MQVAAKKFYNFNRDGQKVSFVRRAMLHEVTLPNEALARAFPYLQANVPLDVVSRVTGVDAEQLAAVRAGLSDNDLYADEGPSSISGPAFYDLFRAALPDWLGEAFSSNYWEVMTSGAGSRALYTGYLLELYHYTRNASRHMPLVVANCPPHWKAVKKMLATHYFEEWDHFDFFADALVAMGLSRDEVHNSEPLPSTLEMSNFMRQAARTSPLCYAICSAILEGTTEDAGSYGEFFRKIKPLYDIPEAAIQPLFDHLALDADYDHKSLFGEVCQQFATIDREQADLALNFGAQMVDHIYMWSEHILYYYGESGRPMLRRTFDLVRD